MKIQSDERDRARILARWDAQLPFGARPLTTREEVLDFTRKMNALGWALANNHYAEALMLLRAAGCGFSVSHEHAEEYPGWGKRTYDFVPRGSTEIVQRLLAAPKLPMQRIVDLLRAGKRSKALQRELALRSLAR